MYANSPYNIFKRKFKQLNKAQYGSIWLKAVFEIIIPPKKTINRIHDIVENKILITMKLIKLSISFTRYSDADFENKAQYVIACMTGNTAFVDPIPALADIKAALTKFSKDLLLSLGKDRILVPEKNKSRKQLELLLGQLGLYVMFVAVGDEAILASSGFSLTKDREPRYITNPGNVTLSNGVTSGEMLATVKKVKGATGYLYEITYIEPTDTTVWTSNTGSKSRFIFKTLIPGKRCWVRVAAIGAGNQIAYSPIASQYAQ